MSIDQISELNLDQVTGMYDKTRDIIVFKWKCGLEAKEERALLARLSKRYMMLKFGA